MSRFGKLRAWVGDVPIADPLRRNHAIVLQLFAGAYCVGALLIELARLWGGSLHTSIGTVVNMLSAAVALAAVVLLRRGSYETATALFVWVLGFIQALAIAVGGLQFSRDGLKDVALVLVLAALLRGRRALWSFVGIFIMAMAVAYARDRGFLGANGPRPPPASPEGIFWVSALSFVIIAIMLDRFGLTVERALRDRERLERHLRQSEELFRVAFQTSPDAMNISRLADGVYVAVNQAFADLTGWPASEALGRTSAEMNLWVDRHDRDRGLEMIRRQGGLRAFEASVRRRDGAVFLCHLTADRFELGGVPHLLTITRDISAQRKLELEAAGAAAALRRSEAMSAIGSLVAGVAHEVRNPIFGMSATLDAMEARLGTDPQQEPFLRMMRRELDRVNALMRDLLEYGRPPAVTLIKDEVAPVVAMAVRSCAPAAEMASVRIDNQVGPDAGIVEMDAPRLAQVFQNLIENAIQHSPAGGVVRIEGSRGGARSAVRVLDSGPGFDPKDLPRIFEPFFSRRRGGTGLGLSIVQRIVEQHHGTLEATNRAEGGASVTVFLPV
ncbi:MAG TPA: ATP-binding protein [Myxococcales bacterium]|nr:ATP-binding protein [Myxococcales bacterium]